MDTSVFICLWKSIFYVAQDRAVYSRQLGTNLMCAACDGFYFQKKIPLVAVERGIIQFGFLGIFPLVLECACHIFFGVAPKPVFDESTRLGRARQRPRFGQAQINAGS